MCCTCAPPGPPRVRTAIAITASLGKSLFSSQSASSGRMMTTGFKSALPTASSSSKAGCRSLPSSGGGKALFSSLNGKGKILSVGHVSGGGAGGARQAPLGWVWRLRRPAGWPPWPLGLVPGPAGGGTGETLPVQGSGLLRSWVLGELVMPPTLVPPALWATAYGILCAGLATAIRPHKALREVLNALTPAIDD